MYSLADFKQEPVPLTYSIPFESAENDSGDDISESCSDAPPEFSVNSSADPPNVIKHTFAAALLKLEHVTHVPSTTINDFFLPELQ